MIRWLSGSFGKFIQRAEKIAGTLFTRPGSLSRRSTGQTDLKKTAARRAISFLTILTAITATLLPLTARGDGVVINEFMASNLSLIHI